MNRREVMLGASAAIIATSLPLVETEASYVIGVDGSAVSGMAIVVRFDDEETHRLFGLIEIDFDPNGPHTLEQMVDNYSKNWTDGRTGLESPVTVWVERRHD